MNDKKRCATCAEEIFATAKKCPHCHTWQSKWRVDPTSPWSYVLWMGIVFVVMWYFSVPGFGRTDFEPYRAALHIVETEMHYGKHDEYSYVSIIGKLRNDSDRSWQDVHFEVRFFDANNHLVDAISDHDYSLIVRAHSDSTFRVRGRADKPKEFYDHFEIDVKKAREVKNWF